MTISRKKLTSLALSLILLLIIAVVAVQLLSKKANPIGQNNISEINLAPAAITADERQELGISDNVQLEIVNRDDNGKITTYRLVK